MAWLTIHFRSKTLGRPETIEALIPQGHGNYKVLYLLHGLGGNHSTWMKKSRLEDYAEHKNIAIIMPSGYNKCYVNNVNGKNYGDYIAKELPELCERWFSISKKAEDRYIAGNSMGGYGAIHAALTHPGVYAGAYSYSGFLDMKESFSNPNIFSTRPVFGEKENFDKMQFDLFEIIGQLSTKKADEMGVFQEKSLKNGENKPFTHKKTGKTLNFVDNFTKYTITCGESDPMITMSRQMIDALKNNNYNVDSYIVNGAHDWDFWDTCIAKTIQEITDGGAVWQ